MLPAEVKLETPQLRESAAQFGRMQVRLYPDYIHMSLPLFHSIRSLLMMPGQHLIIATGSLADEGAEA